MFDTRKRTVYRESRYKAMTISTTRRVPFFTPILDAERRVMMEEERRTLLLRERKEEKEKKDVENEAHETRDDDFSNVCRFRA